MPASQPKNFNLQEFTDVGRPLVGGRIYTYGYGTTAQKIAFADPDGTVPHTYTLDGMGGQYIALNARGELPTPLYLDAGSYDISLKRADGSTVWTRKADGVDSSLRSWMATLASAVGATLLGWANAGNAMTVEQPLDMVYFGVANIDNPRYAGGRQADGSNFAKAMNAALDEMEKRGGGKVFIPPGPCSLKIDDLTSDPSPVSSGYNYFFKARSNVTVEGSRDAVLTIDGGVVNSDAAKQYCKGYQIFWAWNLTTVENFTVRGFTVDCNGVGNLAPAPNAYGSQIETHVVVSNCAKKWKVEDLHVIGTSGAQCIAFYLGSTDVEIKGNYFYDMASSITGNVKLHDHSTIYIECDTYSVTGNRFVNTNYGTVETCIETHGFNGIVARNYGRRYNLGMLRAAMLGDSYNVTNIGNVFDDVTVAVQFDAGEAHRLEALIVDNQFRIRDNARRGMRTPGGVNTAGGFVNRTAANYADIKIVGNSFFAPASVTAAGWKFCLGGNVDYLTLRGNRVVGFAKYYEAGNFVDNSAVIMERDHIEGATGTLVQHGNYVAGAAAAHVDYHIADLDLEKSPGATAFIGCRFDNANIRNVLITGAYPGTIQPYTGFYDIINISFRVDIAAISAMPNKNCPPFVTGRVFDVTHGAWFVRDNVTDPQRWRIKRTGTTIPTASFAVGDDHQGDIVENIAPVAGGYAGWLCVAQSNAAGVVGTWKGYGAPAA